MAPRSKSSKDTNARTSGRGARTTWAQINAMLEWTEVPRNFQLITGGTPPGPVVAGLRLKKTDAYSYLATFVNDRLDYDGTASEWTPESAKARFNSSMKKYKEVKKDFSNVSGPKFCITADELASGKHSLHFTSFFTLRLRNRYYRGGQAQQSVPVLRQMGRLIWRQTY